jgi:hypothetical protein
MSTEPGLVVHGGWVLATDAGRPVLLRDRRVFVEGRWIAGVTGDRPRPICRRWVVAGRGPPRFRGPAPALARLKGDTRDRPGGPPGARQLHRAAPAAGRRREAPPLIEPGPRRAARAAPRALPARPQPACRSRCEPQAGRATLPPRPRGVAGGRGAPAGPNRGAEKSALRCLRSCREEGGLRLLRATSGAARAVQGCGIVRVSTDSPAGR